jgi:8-oxo-dGTP pyrophosphatase MutT (NUDIX family)
MRSEVLVVSEAEKPPESWAAAVLLTEHPRSFPDAPPWQEEAIRLLRDRWAGPGRLVVFARGRSGCPSAAPEHSDGWESDWWGTALAHSDVVICRAPDGGYPDGPAGTAGGAGRVPTAGWDAGHDSGRIVLRLPVRPATEGRHDSGGPAVADAVTAALAHLSAGAERTGAERQVPLPIWRTDSFQRWYGAQRAAGNTLLAARPVWSFRIGADRRLVFYWALHAAVHVAAEDRVKDNEVVISRPDIAAAVLYVPGATLDDTVIVLVREFRTAVSSPDGFVHELPGGSSMRPMDPRSLVACEVREETGLHLDPGRFRAHGSRQLTAPLSAHHAHLFSAEITPEELEVIRNLADVPQGVAAESERTWPEVATFRRIRTERLVDWATLGLIVQALTDRGHSLP